MRFATTPHPKAIELAAALGIPEGALIAAPDWFHVFKSYDGVRFGVRFGVLDSRVLMPGHSRFNSTHKDRGYTQDEAQGLADWLNERERGYASLQRFEGGANWPKYEHITDDTGLSG